MTEVLTAARRAPAIDEAQHASRRRRILVNGAAAIALAGGCVVMTDLGWFLPNYQRWRGEPLPGVLALCALLGVTRCWLPARAQWQLMLLLSAVASVALLGVGAAVLWLYAALAPLVARVRGPLGLRVVAVLGLWLIPALAKWPFSHAETLDHMFGFLVWAGLPFAGVYLVVERHRGQLEHVSWWQEALYLTALPRLVSPFIQPISPANFWKSFEREPRLARVGSALGLGAFGLLLQGCLVLLPLRFGEELRQDFGVVSLGSNFVAVYALNAAHLFVAIALLRFCGFELPSGFDRPLLARSFAEFYRRFNSYIYEAVWSLWFAPSYDFLRRRMPRRLAWVLAAYGSIFVGSYGLTYFLVPLSSATTLSVTWPYLFRADVLLVAAVFWSLIILPQLLPRRVANRVPGWARRAVFLGLLGGLATLIWTQGFRLV